MKIKTDKEKLVTPLQTISGVVERRQTLPILANILIKVDQGKMTLTATDLEVEMKTTTEVEGDGQIELTLPARKLTEICRSLPDGSELTINFEGERAVVRSGKSRFTLGVLPAQDYPAIEPTAVSHSITLKQATLKGLIEKTQFAMAQQDVRYYLNGLLLEVGEGNIKAVATDGHRLAMKQESLPETNETSLQVILPRKAVLELGRLLTADDTEVTVEISSNHIRVNLGNTEFTSKLIDGKFPDYNRVIPSSTDKTVIAETDTLKSALHRTSILSNEKYRGIRFGISNNLLELQAHNPEQEEAKDEMEIDYTGEPLVIGFNVSYLIEALSAIESDSVKMLLSDSNSSCLIQDPKDEGVKYVIMPMRL